MIDLTVLQRHTEGDRDLLLRLSEIFDESYPETLESIADAIASRAWDQLRRPLHKLKGTLGDIGGTAALGSSRRYREIAALKMRLPQTVTSRGFSRSYASLPDGSPRSQPTARAVTDEPLRAGAGDQLRRNAIASISSGSFANEGDTRVMDRSQANRWRIAGMAAA